MLAGFPFTFFGVTVSAKMWPTNRAPEVRHSFNTALVPQHFSVSGSIMARVSTRLRAKLIEIYQQHRRPEDWARRNGMMASFIIADYSGKFPDQFNDPFIKKRVNQSGPVHPAYIERITHLADCLFRLSDEPTFGVMIRRLVERDVRPVFFELSAAQFFKRKGFSITTNEETGNRGEDFDFIANSANGDTINVEVSEFHNEIFTEKALKNKLASKRKQVPNDRPAILFLHIPSSWYNLNNLSFFLMKGTFDFFQKSKRYNAVLFQTEMMGDAGQGFYWLVHIDPFAHMNPRHKIDIQFIFKPGIELLQNEDKMIKYSNETRKKYFEDLIARGDVKGRQSFIRWVMQQVGEV